MEIISFCGAFSSSTLMNTAILKMPTDKKVLIIEGRGMLLARNVETPPQSPGGLKAYLEHCNNCPTEEPQISPYLEKIVREVYILDAADVVSFDWDGFYSERHGYQYLEHLLDQFQKLGFEYVLIDIGPEPMDSHDAFFLAGTYQLPDKVVWIDRSEEFATFQLVLAQMQAAGFSERVKSVITDADHVLN